MTQIKDLLSALDNNNKHFYANLTDEAKKKVSMWMMMRYLSSSQKNPEHYLIMTNELVNVNFSAVRHHPELQWMLASAAGVGKNDFHPWIAPAKKKSKNKLFDAVKRLYPNRKDDELDLLLSISSTDDLIDLFAASGMQDKEITELFE